MRFLSISDILLGPFECMIIDNVFYKSIFLLLHRLTSHIECFINSFSVLLFIELMHAFFTSFSYSSPILSCNQLCSLAYFFSVLLFLENPYEATYFLFYRVFCVFFLWILQKLILSLKKHISHMHLYQICSILRKHLKSCPFLRHGSAAPTWWC